MTSTLLVQFMFILTGYKYMVWFTEYDTCQQITAYTANINNSVHCTCMHHVLLHIRFTLFTCACMKYFICVAYNTCKTVFSIFLIGEFFS